MQPVCVAATVSVALTQELPQARSVTPRGPVITFYVSAAGSANRSRKWSPLARAERHDARQRAGSGSRFGRRQATALSLQGDVAQLATGVVIAGPDSSAFGAITTGASVFGAGALTTGGTGATNCT